MFFVIFVKS